MRALLHVLLFSILGPFVGAHVVWIGVLILSRIEFPDHLDFHDLGVVWIGSLVFSYMVGPIPATLTGIFDYFFKQDGYKKVSFFGGTVSLIASMVFIGIAGRSVWGWFDYFLDFSLIFVGTIAGVIAALACHLLMKRLARKT